MSAKKSHKTDTRKRGKLHYHSTEGSRKRVGESEAEINERVITHSEEGLFGKFFEKRNGKTVRVTIKSPAAGGEYTVTVQKDGGEAKTTKYNKKDLIAFLKGDANYSHMVDYIDKSKLLSRARGRKSKSKSRKASRKTKRSSRKSKKTSKKHASKKSRKSRR